MKKNLTGILAMLLTAFQIATAQTWNIGGNSVGTTGKLGTTNSFALQLITNNSPRLSVTSGGKVGVGTTSPTATFQVQKSALTDVLVKSTGNGAQITIDRAGNGYDAVTNYMQTGVPQWKTGLTVNATGTPDYVISNQITNSDALTISGSNNFVNLGSGYLTLGITNASSINQSGDDLKFTAYAPSTLSGNTAGNIIMASVTGLFKAGNVGIGTNDPSKAKLVVQGSVGQSVAMFKKSASSAGISIAADWPEIYFNSYYNGGVKAMQAGKGALIGCEPGAGTIYFRNTSTPAAADNDPLTLTDRMMIVGDGRVLINNNNYTSTFGVKKIATTDDCATFGGTQHFSHFMFGVNEDTYIRGGKDNSLVVLADAVNQRVTVGGGQAATGYKLSVNGKVICTELRVAPQASWPDYVFKKDYQLLSIENLQKSIEANGHLPGIPAASEIENNGIAVGEMQTKMMQKIEELTLYIIDLQKQLNTLKNSK